MFQENQRLWAGTAKRLVLSCILAMLLPGGTVFGETGPGSKRTHDILPDDYFTLASISNCKLSPDGKFVAYTERRWAQSINRQNSDLWVVEMNSKQTRRLTLDPAADGSGQWSPDSRYLYFMSNRKQANETAERQVWRIAADGSALQQVTRVEGGIALFELCRDGSALYYTLAKKHIADEWKALRTRAMIGKTISHYKILEKLGEGGMDVVYMAEDTELKREVAIKFLPRQIAASEEERQRFKVEAQAAAGLSHPNIATIHNIEEVDDELFFVMEYIDGQELKDKIDLGPLPIDEILNISLQIVKGLNAAHNKDVTHR